jgi:hypothetical protein
MIAKTIYNTTIKWILLYALMTFMANTCAAQLVLPACFTDNLVLQQRAKVNFWGTETPDADFILSTSWNNKSYHVKYQAILQSFDVHHGRFPVQEAKHISYPPIGYRKHDGYLFTFLV